MNSLDLMNITVIGVDGRVRTVPSHLKKQLLAQGFRIITNAREEYYAQHDKTLKDGGWQQENIIEDIDAVNFLEVEKI